MSFKIYNVPGTSNYFWHAPYLNHEDYLRDKWRLELERTALLLHRLFSANFDALIARLNDE